MECASTENQLRVSYQAKTFCVPAVPTVYGAVFKGLDYETGKADSAKPAPFAPYVLHVRPFAKQDRNDQWARQAFAWRYTGGKCTTSTTLGSALQEHWVCLEVGSRILVTVTDCGVLSMTMFFTD